MAVEWALCWMLLALVAADTEGTPQQELQVRYLPHGIQMPKAPYPARRNLAGDPPQSIGVPSYDRASFQSLMQKGPGLELFGPPLPGDNFNKSEQIPQPEHVRPRFRTTPVPNVMEELFKDPPLVQQQALAPPPPAFDLSQFRSDKSAYGFPPRFGRLPQRGQGPESEQRGGPSWYGLAMPTALGPYQRRLKPMLMRPLMQFQPLAPLRDIDDPTKSSTKRAPFDSWLGAQRGDLLPPAPAPESAQLAPLAPPAPPEPPALRGRKPGALRQGGYVAVDNSLSKENITLRSGEKGYVRPKTRRPYVFRGFLQETSSDPPLPALLGEDDVMEEVVPESDDVSLFSDAGNPLKTLKKNRSPSTTFDYIFL